MSSPEATRLLDANVLIALANLDHAHHVRCHRWFGTVTAWATTPITEAAFVRLMLNPRVAGVQRRGGEVLAMLRQLRAAPGHAFLVDDSSLGEPHIDLSGLVGYKQVTDLHLVNLAARHGAVLATLDARLAKTLIGDDQELVELI